MNELSSYISERFELALDSVIALAREHEALKRKYARLARAKQRFAWATVILGALLGIAVAVILIGGKQC